MAICVVVGGLNGKTLESSTTAIGSCQDYVIYTAAEYSALTPQLTPLEVSGLAMSVLTVWAIAWGFKVLRRTF